MHQIACHACDLVQNIPPLPAGTSAQCVRCGSILFSVKVDSINRTLAWTIAGMMLYCIAVTFPFLAMKSGSIIRETALLTGVQQLYFQGKFVLACIVMLTCVLIPLSQMLILLFIFIPLKINLRPPFMIPFFRLFKHVKPWSMMEIYLLAILVSIVKLAKMATIVPGIASIAFGLLIFVLTFAMSSVDTHLVWERLGGER
jgi:paraquat-inducible protein A